MRRMCISIAMVLTAVFICAAQETTQLPRWELGGSINYAYSSMSGKLFPGSSLDYSSKSHFVDVRPRVGYFITPELEPLLEISYAYRWSESTSPAYYPFNSNYQATTTSMSHSLGIGIGGAYNGRLTDLVTLFGGAKVAAHWDFFSSRWSKPEIWFPSFFAGAKFFITPSWSLIGQIEYDHETNLGGLNNSTMDQIGFSGGFGVYL